MQREGSLGRVLIFHSQILQQYSERQTTSATAAPHGFSALDENITTVKTDIVNPPCLQSESANWSDTGRVDKSLSPREL